MKERASWPMKAHEVRAILNGSKTQVRLVVKPQPEAHQHIARHLGDGDWQFVHDVHILADCVSTLRCPYGQPGQRLWAREAFDFIPSGGPDEPQACEIVYWATGSLEPRTAPSGYNPMIYGREKVRPSIHMPRWASRITLEITGVRVERLQDISEADAQAEGITSEAAYAYARASALVTRPAGFAYRDLWDSINGPGSWDNNPWVWAVEFKRVTP